MAGEDWVEALEIARIQIGCGATVLLGLSRQADVAIAQAKAKAEGIGEALTIVRFNRTEPAAMEAVLANYSENRAPITGAIFMPVHAAGEFVGNLVDATDEEIVAFMDVELAGAMALARTLSRYWKQYDSLLQAPRFVFLSNATDGKGDV